AAGSPTGAGSRGGSRSSVNAPSRPTSTYAARQPPSYTSSPNGRLSTSSLARITPVNRTAGNSGRLTTSGPMPVGLGGTSPSSSSPGSSDAANAWSAGAKGSPSA